ncbi:MAG TPA: FAD-dependent oxidoreductase [Alphaproteobacteria bacterium]|nr:FAD-dependent oxidoreductase [Alphaproteobacteria bacterium]
MTRDAERLVVVGNGMAGMRTVEALVKRAPGRYRIAVFGAEPRPNYSRILLSALLAGECQWDEIVINPYSWYADRGIELHAGDAIASIDPVARKAVSAAGVAVSYDKLLLATGSRPLAPPIPGLELPGVSAFREAKDVDAMIAAARPGGRAVVIGGGLLGLEAAWGLARRGMAVTVLHLMPTLMERQLDATAGQLLERDLERRGIAFATEAVAEEIFGDGRGDGARVGGVRLADGRLFDAELVVVAIGIRPETALARAAGLEVNRGIVVGDDLRTSDPDIYAVGECAEHRGRCFGLVAPLWDMAEVCAARLAGERDAVFATPVLSTRLKITGVDLFSAGALMAEAESDDEVTYLDLGRLTYKKLVLREGRIVGAVLYGDVADAAWYLRLIEERAEISALRPFLIFGEAHAAAAGGAPGAEPHLAPSAPVVELPLPSRADFEHAVARVAHG